MDREKVTKPTAQIGFIKFVLIPMFETVMKVSDRNAPSPDWKGFNRWLILADDSALPSLHLPQLLPVLAYSCHNAYICCSKLRSTASCQSPPQLANACLH